mmetsp:Transcript_77643/g.154239  ORF Transcript_77643/g.154239 Transcript_77643/m.154239 type:complete len:81 (-) Transcript_77643:169-411(-)
MGSELRAPLLHGEQAGHGAALHSPSKEARIRGALEGNRQRMERVSKELLVPQPSASSDTASTRPLTKIAEGGNPMLDCRA